MPDITVQDLIRQTATKAGVPPELALAVAEQESGFNPTVLGPKLPSGEQAIGTFQILPSTAKSRGFDPNDPIQNINGGIGYLRELLDQNNGDLDAVLKTYGGVKNDTAYVPGVVGRIKKFQTATPPPSAEPEKPAATGAIIPAGASKSLRDRMMTIQNTPEAKTAVDMATGAAKFVGKQVSDLGTYARSKFPALNKLDAVVPPVEFNATPQNLGEKVGAAGAQAAEFIAPAGAITKAVSALPVAGAVATGLEAAGQAAASYGVTKAQGGTTGDAKINAALGAAGPIASSALEAWAPRIIANAKTKLARVLSEGLENKGPMVDYALKSGNAATSGVAKDVGIVKQAASDLLDLPISASWGKFQTQLAKNAGEKTQSLKAALQGPLGSTEVDVNKLIDSVDNLIEVHTKHLAEMPTGDFREVPFDPKLGKQLGKLRDQLSEYGGAITVRNLSDIKRIWDDAVYTLSTAGKVGVGPETLKANAIKEAKYLGANEIRRALLNEAPSVAELNQAVTHAIRLDDLVAKLHAANPSMHPAMKTMVGAIGAGTGAIAAGGGYAGHILGAHIGGAAALAVVKAMESPLWKLGTPKMKANLAQAIADGRGKAVLRIVTPILQQQNVRPAPKPDTNAGSTITVAGLDTR